MLEAGIAAGAVAIFALFGPEIVGGLRDGARALRRRGTPTETPPERPPEIVSAKDRGEGGEQGGYRSVFLRSPESLERAFAWAEHEGRLIESRRAHGGGWNVCVGPPTRNTPAAPTRNPQTERQD